MPAAAASVWRGLPVTRWRRDATRDADGQFIYLRDVRSGAVWSATYQPSRREPDDYAVTFSADRASFRRRDDDLSTQLDIAVSTEDDVEVRRLTVRNHGDAHPRARRDQLCRDRPHARRRTISPIRRSASCSSRPSTCPTAPPCSAIGGRAIHGEPSAWAFHALSLEGRPQGPVEWETDRARFLGRGRDAGRPAGARRPRAVGHDRHRARSDRQPAPADPAARRAPPCGCALPPAWPRIARRPRRWRGSTTTRTRHARTFALAMTHAQSAPASSGDFGRRGACCSSGSRRACSAPTARCAQRRRRSRRTSSASRGCGRTRSPAICRSCSSAWSATRTCALVRQVLQAQEYWRLKGLSADVVIVNEHPVSYLDEMQAQLDGRARRRPVEHLAASARRRLSAARRSHGPRRARPARSRGGARSSAATTAICGRSSIARHPPQSAPRQQLVPTSVAAPATRPTNACRCPVPSDDAGQRARRLHRRRTGLRDRPRRRRARRRCRG